nr:uncharacterized protein LOC132777828 isoform X3 [Anolis sagrei ordinatus]
MGDCEDKTDYAVCAIILASQEKEEENKWRRKRGPTRRWRKRRAQKGAFLNLNQELRGEDPTSYKYIDVGTQGRISDGGVWNKCNLKELIDVNTLDMPPAHPLPGQDIPTPYVFLADNAFGLKPYILKPYGGNDLTLEERICNYRISRGRQVVETAFGSFANRLRVFLNPILLQPDKVRTLVLAGCALHNFLRSHESTESWPVNYVDREDVETGTTLPGAWRTEIPIQPGTDLHLPQVATTYSNYYSTEAKAVRENFKAFFTSDVGAVYWQHRFV